MMNINLVKDSNMKEIHFYTNLTNVSQITNALDNINSRLSSIDSKVSSANTLLTQIEANTK